MIKGIILILTIFSIGLVIYFWGSSNQEVSKQNISTNKPKDLIPKAQKPPQPTIQVIPLNSPEKKKKLEGLSSIKKNQYFKKIRDTIKDQWNELEECENEFDMHFGDLLKMGQEQAMEYLKDPNNLDNFLEKISSFNMTTPSSAKMIKQLAEPIASEMDWMEILETVGYVKTCRDREKYNLRYILFNLKNKNKKTAWATIAFFENENSTLTYPDILYNQIVDLVPFLEYYGLKKSDFPEIAQIKKDQMEFHKRKSQIYERVAPEDTGKFNPKAQKEDYDYALKLQPRIKSLLKKIKEKFI